MIAPLLWCLLAAPGLPGVVVIATPRGQTSVPITLERGGAAVAVPLLAQPLGLTVAIEGSRVAVTVGGAAFVFQLGAPFVRAGGTVYGLVGEPYTARDTVFLPLSWLADCVPRALGPRYRWDARSEEHTSELQSRLHLVCPLLLEKKKFPLAMDESAHKG